MPILHHHYSSTAPVESGIDVSDAGFVAFAEVHFSEAPGDSQRFSQDVSHLNADDQVNVMRSFASQAQKLYLDRSTAEAEKAHATAVVAAMARLQELSQS